MGLARRKFTKEFKLAALQQMEAGSSTAEVARAFEVTPKVLYRWRDEFRHGLGNAFSGSGRPLWDETRVAQLERKVGQPGLEIDFFDGMLAAHRGTAEAAGIDWKPRFTTTTFKRKSSEAAR